MSHGNRDVPTAAIWQTTRFDIDLSEPRLMGVVNVTPDSFSAAGQGTLREALEQCDRLCREGADMLDIGGESTRPGARPVDSDEECARVLPVLRHALSLGLPVSVDTRHTAVMRAALDAGTDIINDVAALRDDGAEQLLAAHPRAGVCLMHMRGEPASMQQRPLYDDVLGEVLQFLGERAERLVGLGVGHQRIVLDPGIGFGKTAAHNISLHRQLRSLVALGFPVLVGWSRKSTLGTITGKPVHERIFASIAAALAAVANGARILRVHDVSATRDALRVWLALQHNGNNP